MPRVRQFHASARFTCPRSIRHLLLAARHVLTVARVIYPITKLLRAPVITFYRNLTNRENAPSICFFCNEFTLWIVAVHPAPNTPTFCSYNVECHDLRGA